MEIDLLYPTITINISVYQPGAGWDIATDIPEDKLDTPMTVLIERPMLNKKGEWEFTVIDIQVEASYFLDDIVAEIAEYISSINEETEGYFEDHCFLESIYLDTDTMIATTLFGS